MPTIVFDGSNGTATASSASTLMTLNMDGFASVHVQVTEAGDAGCVISYETSINAINWVACEGTSVGDSTSKITTGTTTGMWDFGQTGRYFRARVSSYSSGTLTVYWYQKNS